MTRIRALLGLCVTAIVTSAIPTAAQQVVLPNGQVYRAGPDYATDLLHDPWDFTNVEDIGPFPDDYIEWVQSSAALVNGPSVFLQSGSFRATSAPGHPRVGLLFEGIGGTVIPGRSGQRYPIDSTRYNKLAIKMRVLSGPTGSPPAATWFTGMRGQGSNFQVASNQPTAPGERIYLIDLDGQPGFQGLVTGLRLHPTGQAGVDLAIDWVRLTTSDGLPGAAMMPVQLNNCSEPRHVDVFDGTSTTRVLSNVGTSRSFNYGIFPPGNYELRASCSNGSASLPFAINDPPRITVLQPSERGVQDYATTVLGNPWDFADPAVDVPVATNVQPVAPMPPGFLRAVSTGPLRGDPSLYFLFGEHGARPIATTRYRYATFSLGLNTPFSLGDGSVARLLWASTAGGFDGNVATTTAPIVVWPGMNTYTVDLATLSQPGQTLEPCTQCYPWTSRSARYFRLDPHEFSNQDVEFFVGPVTLTTPAEVGPGGTFRIQWRFETAAAASVNLYYDVDRDPTNGKQLIASGVAGTSYDWTVGALAPRDYYIYVEVNEAIPEAFRRGTYATGALRVINAANSPVLTLSQSTGSTAHVPFALSGCAYNAAVGAAADEVLVYAHPLEGQMGGAVQRLGYNAAGGLGTQGAAACATGPGYQVGNVFGLASGFWTFRVLARNTVTGDFNEVRAQNVRVDWRAAPARNVRASVSGNTVVLAWDPPTQGSLTQYRIEAANNPSFAGFAHVVLPPSQTSVSGTLGNGTYYIRVVTGNTYSNDGPPSNVVHFTLPGGGSVEPPGAIALTGQLTSNPVSLQWSQGGGGAATYAIHAGSSPGASDIGILPMGGAMSLPPVVLPPGTSIYARIVASNAGGSAVSNEVLVRIPVPGPPGGPPVQLDPVVSANTVTIRWNPPADGGVPTSYAVVARYPGSAAIIALAPGLTTTSLTVPGVPRGTYLVTVAAMYGSTPSAESNSKTLAIQ